MLSSYLTAHCAPTLAAMKSASLFRFRISNHNDLFAEIRKFNNILSCKGIRITLLSLQKDTALIYVYRPKQLQAELMRPDVQNFLQQYGYHPSFSLAQYLTHLRNRMNQKDFPHEIGVFLSYPLSDVIAFIENHGQNSCCTGCWKAYGNPVACQKLFSKFKKCTKIYCRLFAEGRSLEQMTVAA